MSETETTQHRNGNEKPGIRLISGYDENRQPTKRDDKHTSGKKEWKGAEHENDDKQNVLEKL
ncbi:MAG: hypothetical protein K5739_12595 [Lachnospiraceae bacterium]|nr:hypothetical protein [Lachnospiraceae bacterium]